MNCLTELPVFIALVSTALGTALITLGICAAWAYRAMKVEIK